MPQQLSKLFKQLSPKELTVFFGAILLFAISATLYVASYIVRTSKEMPTFGGEWREGVVGQPIFINPVISGNDADKNISNMIYSSLETLGEIKKEASGQEWTVRLKEDLKWSDGEKITSDDIVFTIETILNPDSNSPSSQSFQGARVVRVSELETKFILPAPYVFFESTLKKLQIIPKHIFGDIPPTNFRLSPYVLKPVSSGPYMFESMKEDKNGFFQEYRLKLNPYFLPRPYIKNIIFRFYTSEEKAIAAYNNDQIDSILITNPENIDGIKIRHTIDRLSSPRYYAIFINQSSASILKDIKVRAALSEAIDRNQLVDQVFKGFAYPLFGPLPGIQASSIQASAPSNANLTLSIVDLPQFVKTAELIKTDWQKIGVNLEIKTYSSAEIREIIRKRDYQLILFGNTLTEPEDLYSFWHSSNKFHPGTNLAIYQNQKADVLMETIRSDFNSDRRNTEVKELMETIANDIPAIFLYSPDYLYVVSPKLNGFETTSIITPSDRLLNIEKWYVKTRRQSNWQ